LFVPWIASCNRITDNARVFEPRISGATVRTSKARSLLQAAVADTAARHDFRRDEARAYQRPVSRNEESLLSYYKNSGLTCMELYRDYSSGTDKVRLLHISRFGPGSEFEAIEHEIQTSLR
jgi:hypothetical protein